MRYFVIGKKVFDKGYAYCEYENDSKLDEAKIEKCPRCGAFLSGMPIMPPYRITLSTKKLGDFIFGIWDYFIVSAEFKKQFINSGLTGIKEFYKIDRIRYKKEILDVDYYGIIPQRVDARPIPIEQVSEPKLPVCSLCNPFGRIFYGVRGLRMDSNRQESIPDIFSVYTNGMAVYCNQIFLDFCKTYGFTNFEQHIESFEEYANGCLVNISSVNCDI